MCLITSCATKQTTQQHNDSFINGEKVSKSTLIVYYDGAEGKANAVQAIRKMHAEILYDLKNMPILTIHLPEKQISLKAKKTTRKGKWCIASELRSHIANQLILILLSFN